MKNVALKSLSQDGGWVYACLNVSQSSPNWRTMCRSVPVLRSLLPQSGTGEMRSVAGLYHLRWEVPLRRGSS